MIEEHLAEKHLPRLHKRLAHLRQRILASPHRHLSYDEAEASALAWVISVVEKLFRREGNRDLSGL